MNGAGLEICIILGSDDFIPVLGSNDFTPGRKFFTVVWGSEFASFFFFYRLGVNLLIFLICGYFVKYKW